MSKLFLLTGHCASGKSYFAKQFAEENGYRYLSIDDMYTTFNGARTHENKFLVWMTFFQQIHAAEVAGHNIVVDTNAPTFLDRSEFLSWFPSFEHHLIWVNASPELCMRNNKNRDRIIPDEAMQKLFEAFEPPYEDRDIPNFRAKWQSVNRINNYNNVFTPMKTLSGTFSNNVKIPIDN